MKDNLNKFIKQHLASIISIVCLVAATILIVLNIESDNRDEYLEKISYSQLEEKINNQETFILYIGSEECSACAIFKPKLINVLYDNQITAYYLDLNEITTDDYISFGKFMNITGTPTLAFIIEGEEEGTDNRIENGSASEDYIINKLKLNGYIK